MAVTGIIAEFNPLHNGHKYLLEQVQGLKIVAMSGNFVQRGEPALVDKWTRTQMALECGADVVVELPFLVAVQAADYFAEGAIAILKRLGVDTLTFGTEQVLDYNAIGDSYMHQREEISTYLESLPDVLSYPQKTQAMWEKFTGSPFSGATPNHILALSYAKAARSRGISLNPIRRLGEGYHSQKKKKYFASATSIRKHRKDSAFVESVMPNADLFHAQPQVSWADYFDLLRYQIIIHPDLAEAYQVNHELAHRIKSAIRSATSVEDLTEKVSTKRYTKARVRRLLTYILVNARETQLPKSVHVLGFSKKGRQHLSSLKEQVSLVTRIGKTPWDAMTQKADAVYQLGNSRLSEQNWGRIPIMTR
ncbi:nucleotidyltransferase [Streptococcus sciuri]|uniref:tRNA(Met) cytidine acetate ligase n=1 Tax=Streptococcus sciuri TaxID=2973939 RepID=A0ABT2F8A9_9STRE|nr:nucleotidyltransferase [Streptococcus sciuri]MCS4488664.1 nucleotidyltransferase [Streptococcus sciuri]